MLRDEGEHGAQVVEVEQQQALVVRELEGDLEHACLHVVELEHAGQQARTDLADGGPDRVAAVPIEVPEHDGAGFRLVVDHAELGGALLDLLAGRPRLGQPRHVALDVGDEDRHSEAREALGQHHERDGLAGAGGAGDEAVAITVAGEQVDRLVALAEQDLIHAPERTPSGAPVPRSRPC